MIDLSKVKPGDMLGVRVWEVVRDGICITVHHVIEADLLHPLPEPSPDPHAGLRDAVVEAAQEWRKLRAVCGRDRLIAAVDALNAAKKPADPIAELLAAARAAVVLNGYNHADRERLSAAIAAVEAMGSEG